MRSSLPQRCRFATTAALFGALALAGCAATPQMRLAQIECAPVPRELDKATLPTYVVEPPDILLIEATQLLRPVNAPLLPGDRLRVQLRKGLPIEPGVEEAANRIQYEAEMQVELAFKLLAGSYRIGADGNVDFGPSYGQVAVAGMTIAQAQEAVRRHLETDERTLLKEPEVVVTLEDIETAQAVAGEHLVRPDGRVSLGIYGEVYVAGMSLGEVKQLVERHLSEYVADPKVSVDVLAYNSKNYYIITDGGGRGDSVSRFPVTGNETVLDAISNVQGLSDISSKRIWIARPAPAGIGVAQILEVEWEDITALGQTATNYQVLPGDRIYVQADRLIAAETYIGKVLAPLERVAGATLLGLGVVRTTQQGAGSTGGGFF
jgi:polysaccharide export outer membrane protein